MCFLKFRPLSLISNMAKSTFLNDLDLSIKYNFLQDKDEMRRMRRRRFVAELVGLFDRSQKIGANSRANWKISISTPRTLMFCRRPTPRFS